MSTSKDFPFYYIYEQYKRTLYYKQEFLDMQTKSDTKLFHIRFLYQVTENVELKHFELVSMFVNWIT